MPIWSSSAYDGSKAGRMGSDIRLEVRSPRAVAALLGAPGQLGLVRAYVSGDLVVSGDLFTALVRLAEAFRGSIPWRQVPHLTKEFAPYLLRRTQPPPEEVSLGGRRHGKQRDAAAIAHHYDVSNAFYEWILGPSMAYTCAVFPTADASLQEAQQEKFDLVCRKLDLRPGQRLLDVGCGWGGMARHAAQHYGVNVVAVTLSEQQARWGQRMIAEAGLDRLVDLRHGDYRDVPETGFDAVSSIGLTEHIGKRNHPVLLPLPALAPARRGAAAEPLHHTHRSEGADAARRCLHQSLHLPRRGVAAPGPSGRADGA